MLKYAKEFKKYILITGFKNVKIRDKEKFLKAVQKAKTSKVEAQFFDAKTIATWQHLYFAALNALKAFKNKRNISRNLAMETMLYASAQRQIKKAMNILGVKSSSSEIAVLIIGEKPEEVNSALANIQKIINVKNDDKTLEFSEEKMALAKKNFEISDEEIKAVMRKGDLKKALVDLVIERVALLATKR